MKRLFYLLFVTCLFYSCTNEDCRLYLTNVLDETFTDVPFVISRNELSEYFKLSHEYPLLVSENGDTLVFQLDDIDTDGKWDELAFLCDFTPNEKKTIFVSSVSSFNNIPKFGNRTNIRYGKMIGKNNIVELSEDVHGKYNLPRGESYPYQLDGPTWENDKVAFRHYFDGRNNRDVFGKLTSYMVMDTVGINNDGVVANTYSSLNDWGRDILTVGSSLGLGGLALLTPDSLIRLGVMYNDMVDNVDFTSFKLISEGPVRSVFELQYSGWDIGLGKIDSIKEKITIWAGHYSYESKINTSFIPEGCHIVTGMVDIENDNDRVMKKIDNKYIVMATHDRQANNKETYLGLGIIVPVEQVYKLFDASDMNSNICNTWCVGFKKGISAEYEAYAVWAESDKVFSDRNFFIEYIEKQTKLKSNPIKIEY